MIQQGTYRARAVASGVKFGRASTGTEQIAVPFMIEDERPEVDGRSITWIGSFASDKSITRTCEGLRAAGWSTDNLTDLAGLGSVECEIVVEDEQGTDGEWRPKVKWVNAVGGGFKFKNELDAGGVMALAERIKGAAIASRQDKPAAKGAPPARRQVPAKEWDGQGAAPPDEIPF